MVNQCTSEIVGTVLHLIVNRNEFGPISYVSNKFHLGTNFERLCSHGQIKEI